LAREVSEYTDTMAQVGSAYRYHLRAVNAAGVEGARSHDVRVMAFEPAPLPPGGVRVARAGSALKIHWDQTQQSSVAGYRIYRHGERDAVAPLVSTILSPDVTEYSDDSVRPGERYYYSVSCVNRAGAESDRSVEISFLYE
jgi:fibronectin type 3 domain-containing protein